MLSSELRYLETLNGKIYWGLSTMVPLVCSVHWNPIPTIFSKNLFN